MLATFYRFFIRPLRREPLRTALTAFAVALGVAVVLAIELAGTAAAGSFRASLESLTGKADFEVTAVGGLAPETLTALSTLPAPLTVRARIEDYASVQRTRETVPLIGLDMVAEALDFETGNASEQTWREDNIWVGPRLAKRAGETIRLIVNDRTHTFTVAGILKETPGSGEAGNVVVMDLATADRMLARNARLDRILIDAPDTHPVEHWEALLTTALPRDAALARFGARTEENRKMLAAFRWNLRVLSYIALVVGAFLIYNTISVSVVRRRAEIGIFRALGATRFGVLAAFLGEAALFGLIGAAAGLFLGRAMAEGAVHLIGATVESLYVSSTPGRIELGWEAALFALAIGLGISLASAFAPALEASRVTPIEAMARGRAEYDARVHRTRDLLFAALLGIAAALASRMPPVAGKPLFGYLAALLLIAAGALAVPALVSALSMAGSTALRRLLGVEALLASRSLVASLRRSSVLVAALATAIAMMASVGIMVGSFRETVLVWMDSQLRADLYIRPAGPAAADRHPTMSPAVPGAIEQLPAVEAVDRFRALRISYRGLPVTLGAGETRIVERYSRTRFLDGDRAEILRRLPTGDFVIVSEPFANKHRVHRGDRLTLNLAGAPRTFEVLGVYYDYASERGYIVMDRSTLLKYLPDPAPSNLAVYLKPAADLESARAAIERATAGSSLLIMSNRTIRTEAIKIFDRTFAITYALEAVAVVVAVMGIAGALLALVIDRRRELGLLRFLGASQPQVRRLILCEAGLIGILANIAGLALGVVLSLILIYVINKQSFGWTIQFHWPVGVLLGALTVIYAATILAGLYPARIATRLNPIEVVHEE
ncbi:MAG: FtsX-like permease family protein [Bryobacteraceae bacterium]|nr:FtsX-like permease family protein [Bryobacteraceae bacterium]